MKIENDGHVENDGRTETYWSFERKTLLGDNPDPEKSELL